MFPKIFQSLLIIRMGVKVEKNIVYSKTAFVNLLKILLT